MAEKRNIILFGALIILTISYWISASFFIGDKPFKIKLLEQEETELNENLISAQILASKLDRVYTLFQENLALSQQDSLAEDDLLGDGKWRKSKNLLFAFKGWYRGRGSTPHGA